MGRLGAALLTVLLVASAVGCADLANEAVIGAHPDGWIERGGENFHGMAVLESAFKTESCTTCHGEDYQGGTSGVSCSTSRCHESYPHPEADFMNPQAGEFHGNVVLASATKEAVCSTCHGADYAGGRTGVSCYGSGCHGNYPHGPVFGGPNAAATHAAYVRDGAHWDLGQCSTCHGETYDGKGVADKTCLTCHNRAGGPEACDTCHGQGDAGAPPPDLYGHFETTRVSVGAHSVHVDPAAGLDACVTCHVTPAEFESAGHLDGSAEARAEIVFGPMATGYGKLTPVYSAANATCAGSWCHGGFEFPKSESRNQWIYSGDSIKGIPSTPTWNVVGSGEAACATCHGLPPEGHRVFPQLKCGFCHPSASTTEDFVIVDKTLHANGKADVY